MSRVDSFRVIRELSHNDFSIVEEVETRAEPGLNVALKRPTPEALQNSADRSRFVREIELLKRLDHPHIVPILEAELSEQDVWFTMPMGETSLDRLISFGSPISEEEIYVIFGQILAAFSHAHSRGIVHRDLNPRNIIMFRGAAVVVDFGLGRHLLGNSARLTEMGERGGTFGYVAPEQWRDLHEVDQRSDIFALGSVLFALATRENPATHDPRKLVPRFGFIINKCREIDPDRRYSTVADLASDFYALWELDSHEAALVETANSLIEEAKSQRSAQKQLLELYLRNPDDISLYLETIPQWPVRLISMLDQESPDDFAAVVDVLDGHLSGRLGFEAVDGYADCLVRIYHGSVDQQVRRSVLNRLISMGERHNRFYVGRKFAALVGLARQANDILAIRSVILSNPAAARWAREWVALVSLPEHIQSAFATISESGCGNPKVEAAETRSVTLDEPVEVSPSSAASLPMIHSRYALGDVVAHRKFGNGTIIDIVPRANDQEVAVEFDRAGPKRLLASLAAMEVVGRSGLSRAKKSDSYTDPTYATGQTVLHPKFGRGTVTEVVDRGRDQEVAVTFDRFGPKRLLARLAAMENIGP